MFPNVCCMNRSGPHLITGKHGSLSETMKRVEISGLFLYLFISSSNESKIKIGGENCLALVIINNNNN